MKRLSSPNASTAALRALKTIAMANGVFDEAERSLLATAAWLYEVDLPAEVASIDAAALAAAIQPEDASPVMRHCMLMALVDHEVSEQEWRPLRAYAEVMHLSEDELRTYHDEGLSLRLFAQQEQERRQIGLFLQELNARQGQRGLEAFFRKQGNLENPAISWRYRRLGIYPEQSLGRALWAYCHLNDFGLPGEIGGLPEPWLWHDLLHVLTEHSTDSEGEAYLAAFTAGVMRQDAFSHVLLALLSAQSMPSRLKLEKAYARGLATREAFVTKWDFWGDLSLTLSEARAKFGIAI